MTWGMRHDHAPFDPRTTPPTVNQTTEKYLQTRGDGLPRCSAIGILPTRKQRGGKAQLPFAVAWKDRKRMPAILRFKNSQLRPTLGAATLPPAPALNPR